MLVRNNQTLEEISEIVGLDLDALRELKKEYLIEWMCDHIHSFILKFLKTC